MTVIAIETTSDTTRTSWEEHTEAARDLILVALDRVHGTIESADGHLVSKLRDLCRLDATPTTRATITEALVLMEEAGLIQRDFIAETICSISLTRELSGGEIGELVASEEDSRKLLSTHSSATRERERILQDCMEAYRAFCRAADAAELVNEHGYVALNFTGVAKSIGLIRRDAKRARHYLRLLKLIKSHGVCNDATEPGDSERHLYWWEVTTNVTIDPAALMELMSGEQSFEAEEARRIEKQARREDGQHERRFAGDTPAVLPDDLCSPVTVRLVEEAATRRPTPLDIPSRPPAKPTDQPDVDPLLARHNKV